MPAIVATVDAQPGASVEKGGKILTVYTDESLQVQLPVAEADLSLIQVGQKVRLEFTWDPNQTTVFEGEVVSLSYLNANAAADTSAGGRPRPRPPTRCIPPSSPSRRIPPCAWA